MTSLSYELERTVVDAWPAEETADLEGWLLRKSGGPTRRGNSVATWGAAGPSSLVARIERAEEWYRERGRPAQFHIGPCATPGLDAKLAGRGYRAEGLSVCAVAPVSGGALVGDGAPREHSQTASSLSARVDTSPSEAWLELLVRSGRFAGSEDVFMGFLARIGDRARYVSVESPQGDAVAACLGVTSEARWGVYSMLTAPAFRRQGAGRAALGALARSAADAGVGELYLLVERDNVGARSLYAQSGFRDVYDYHYRVLALSSPP
jgi:GNAT superfamily N-acetyltransferase